MFLSTGRCNEIPVNRVEYLIVTNSSETAFHHRERLISAAAPERPGNVSRLDVSRMKAIRSGDTQELISSLEEIRWNKISDARTADQSRRLL